MANRGKYLPRQQGPQCQPYKDKGGDASAGGVEKDIRLALERAAELKTACPLAERLKEIFSDAMNAGWGEEDFAVLYRLISEKSTKAK